MPLNLMERPQWYVGRLANPGTTAGLLIENQELQLDSDAPFRLTGVALYVVGDTSANQTKLFRFTRHDQSWVQKWLTSAQALNPFDQGAVAGAGGLNPPFYSYFAPVHPNLLYQPGSSILMDYQDLTGSALVLAVFIGTKIYERGQVWAPSYPARYTARPFLGYALQFNSALLPLLDQPLNILADADFVWQSGCQSDGQAGHSPGQLRGLGVRVKDWVGKYYMNDYVPAELMFGFDNVEFPGLLYPEIYIPKNEAIYFDLDLL